MASFTNVSNANNPQQQHQQPTNVNASKNLLNRELNIIASSFVKQYYTLLNKAPCYIHNFYSPDSTFIHGTIGMANEHYTKPIVGKEKIKRKMEDLKLNDCRAKITQIDCLETLAGGLVIQVIGELSNNGKPMRRFLQTFVLAPSLSESSQEGGGHADARRSVHSSENNSSSHNQKFFVLNSIFRYQDDGPDSEFEDDSVSLNANTSTDSPSSLKEAINEKSNKPSTATPNVTTKPPQHNHQPQQPQLQQQQQPQQQQPIAVDAETKRVDAARAVSNGTGVADKKMEAAEKSTENGKSSAETSAQTTKSAPDAGSQTSPTVVNAPSGRPQPVNEPKTWANMVRNAHPQAATIQANVTKSTNVEQHPSQQHHHQNSSQSAQSHHQQQPLLQQLQQQPSHPQQPIQLQTDQQQNAQNKNTSNNNNNNNNNNNSSSNNNRRRHMVRKPTNNSTGRALKNRPRPTTTGKPIA